MNCKRRSRQVPRLPLLVLTALALVFITTPGAAQLLLEPAALHGGDSAQDRGVKVCLIVRDARNESVVRIQMCGLIRNGYGKTMQINVLGNKEPLDKILAYSFADSLEFAGYDVVQVYPERPVQLEAKPRKLKTLKPFKADFKVARSSQARNERGDARAEHEREAAQAVASLNEISGKLAAPGSEGWANGADAVVEITIDTFTSDQSEGTLSLGHFVAWSAATLRVASGEPGDRGTITTTDLRGWGERNSGFGTPKKKITRALNLSYRSLVEEAEAVFLSNEFFAAIQSVSGIVEKSN